MGRGALGTAPKLVLDFTIEMVWCILTMLVAVPYLVYAYKWYYVKVFEPFVSTHIVLAQVLFVVWFILSVWLLFKVAGWKIKIVRCR